MIKGKPIQVRHRQRPIHILFNLEHPEGPPAEVIEDEESPNDDIEDEDEIQSSNKSGIQEELNKLTFIVAGSSALKDNPLWIPISDIFDTQLANNNTLSNNNDNAFAGPQDVRLLHVSYHL